MGDQKRRKLKSGYLADEEESDNESQQDRIKEIVDQFANIQVHEIKEYDMPVPEEKADLDRHDLDRHDLDQAALEFHKLTLRRRADMTTRKVRFNERVSFCLPYLG
jgi:hypothetical protein